MNVYIYMNTYAYITRGVNPNPFTINPKPHRSAFDLRLTRVYLCACIKPINMC